MNKKFTVVLFLSLLLAMTTPAQAGIRSIVDWGGENAKTDSAGFYIDSPAAAAHTAPQASDYCNRICTDYDINTSVCPDGMELRSCAENSCENYKRCVGVPCRAGYDTEVKACDIEIQTDNYFCSKCKE